MRFLLHRLEARNFKQLADVCLTFPSQGTVLIEGANEAGKSTLFEAIYFALYGSGLMDARAIQPLKKYGTDKLYVVLEFSVNGRMFIVQREIRVNQTVELLYYDSEGNPQKMRGSSAVDKFIAQELDLTAGALRNTCFVEQKDLGRLEEMRPAARIEAINELLNLDILTSLAEEFKITTEQKQEIVQQHNRVEVARLDDRLPDLQANVETARRRSLYARMCAFDAQWQGLHQEIELAEHRQIEIQKKRDAIRSILEMCATLTHRLTAIETDLMHRATSWQEAEVRHQQAANETKRLRDLADALPEQEQRLSTLFSLGDQLQQLEALETKEADLQASLANKTDAISGYDALLRDWKEGETERERLEADRDAKLIASQQASELWRKRQGDNARLPQLSLLLRHIEAHETATREADELQAQITRAQEYAAQLLTLQQRVSDLEAVETEVRQRTENRQQQALLIREDEELTQREAAQAARLTRIAELNTQIQAQETKIKAAVEEVSDAAKTKHQVSHRAALEEWALAAGRHAQADPESGRLAELRAQQQAAIQSGEQAETQRKQEARKTLTGLIIIIVGLGIGIGGLVMGLVALYIVAGLALAGGAVPLVTGLQAQQATRQTLMLAQSQSASLRGSIEEANKQLLALTQEQEARARREAECRAVLEALHEEVPANVEAAGELIARLPSLSRHEAEEGYNAAETVRRDAEAVLDRFRGELSLVSQAAQGYDHNIPTRLQEIHSTLEGLAEALVLAEDLPDRLQTLGTDEDNLLADLSRARTAGAEAEAQAQRLPDLQIRQAEKSEQAEREEIAARQEAHALVLAGATLSEWKQGAQEQQSLLETERQRLPDAEIEAANEAARSQADTAGRRLTTLEEQQRQRREGLDAQNRDLLIEEHDALAASLVANRNLQAPLSPVRTELRGAEMPVRYTDLSLRLVAMQTALEQQQNEAAKLADAIQQEQNFARNCQARAEALQAAWRESLPEEEIPSTTIKAAHSLTAIAAKVQRQLDAQNEAGRREEDARLDREQNEIGRKVATLTHQQQEARKSLGQLLEMFPLSPDTSLDTLPDTFPELVDVDQEDVEITQQEWEQARQTVQTIQADRDAQAKLHGIGTLPLSLDEEERELAKREHHQAVRRQSGDIVHKTRKAIIASVMPLTLHNMNRLLPLLTDNRYREAKWDDTQNAISVYDERSRDFQAKKVFSGGARDQISLTLRLAFALATLPGEHSVRPGWLFLDEPLSSFDKLRTRALVDLLTKGLIRREFDQIFLVSHSESFDPTLFDYRLRMEDGRVAECTLPA